MSTYTADHLSSLFGERYHSAESGFTVVTIHLFGIEFADALTQHDLKAICSAANVPLSYATELRKGMRLAEFVALK